MSDYPRSLREFDACFPDDETCARWLSEKRWPDGFNCPACGHGKGFELERGVLTYQCAGCRKQTSVTAGTVLHGSHLPLKVWFLAAWLVATHRNGISARQLWLQLGLGSECSPARPGPHPHSVQYGPQTPELGPPPGRGLVLESGCGALPELLLPPR